MPYTYKPDILKKKKMLDQWRKSRQEWKNCKMRVIALLCLGAALFAAVQILTFTSGASTDDPVILPLVSILCGFILGFVPVKIGQSLYTKGKIKFGEPYSTRENEFLTVNDRMLEYGYHDSTDPIAGSMKVYRMDYQNIKSIDFDEMFQIATIAGQYEFIPYTDGIAGCIDPAYPGGKTVVGVFSFLYCYDQKDEFFRQINEKKQKNDQLCTV